MAAAASAAVAALQVIQFGKDPEVSFFVIMHAFYQRHTFNGCGITGGLTAQIFQSGKAMLAQAIVPMRLFQYSADGLGNLYLAALAVGYITGFALKQAAASGAIFGFVSCHCIAFNR